MFFYVRIIFFNLHIIFISLRIHCLRGSEWRNKFVGRERWTENPRGDVNLRGKKM